MAAKHFLCVQRNASAEMLDFHALLFAIVVEYVTADALNNFWIFFNFALCSANISIFVDIGKWEGS